MSENHSIFTDELLSELVTLFCFVEDDCGRSKPYYFGHDTNLGDVEVVHATMREILTEHLKRGGR